MPRKAKDGLDAWKVGKRRVIMPKPYCIHFFVNKDGSCFQCGLKKELQAADLAKKDAWFEAYLDKLERELP